MANRLEQVRIADFAASGRAWVRRETEEANVDGNSMLSAAEARRLPADLRDNFEKSLFKRASGSVPVTDFRREFEVLLSGYASAASRDGEFLTTTEVKKLPSVLQDNYARFLAAERAKAKTSGGVSSRDATEPGVVDEHLAEFPNPAVGYEKAFDIALKTAFADEADGGLRYLVREIGDGNGNPITSKAKLDAELKRLLSSGSINLLPVTEDIPTGQSAQDGWIFAINTTGQGDNGVWVTVDRSTGSASSSSFN